MKIQNLQNENRKFIKSIDNFHVLEYTQDASVSPFNALNEYFMSKMNVRRRQVVIDIDKNHSAVIQAGAMQWMGGAVKATSGVKGIGDLFGKALKGAVTKETAVKPEYVGEGCLVLEPTYKYIILEDVEEWGPAGMTIEDGMFLACDANVKQNVVTRKNISSSSFYILRATQSLGVLIECGFLSNANERGQLKSRSYHKKLATVISDGIQGYFQALSAPL